jgi:hypothetical protein
MVRYGFSDLVDMVCSVILSVWTATGNECDSLNTGYEVAIVYSRNRTEALRVIESAATACGFIYP